MGNGWKNSQGKDRLEMKNARAGGVIAGLLLYVLLNILGELLGWSLPVWAGLIDIAIGALILWWASKVYSTLFH